MSQSTPILHATSTGGDVNLSGFPGLTYAPGQWGPGIRLAHNGLPIEEVATHPDLIAAVESLKARAAAHGIPDWGDLCDAVRFLEKTAAKEAALNPPAAASPTDGPAPSARGSA